MSVSKAVENATRLRAGDRIEPPVLRAPRRRFAIGDPQSSTTRFFGALDAHGLLGDDGWLGPDVRLIAMGDYFDYRVAERDAGRVEGVLNLMWLAAHAPEHVTILFGNHDAARVMEFATITDERFREAADAATPVVELRREDREAAEAELLKAFPDIPTAGYVARDFNAFTVEQRVLVQRLLVANRFALATVATIRGTPVLATHAGITKRELEYLCTRDHQPQTIADALCDRLAGAVRQVAADWSTGTSTPLSLEPIHVAGAAGEEGGGLLYHRPADPERPGADPSWESASRAPRKYDPRTALPRGLAQMVGHTGHSKACKEMPRWRTPDTDAAKGGVRTLRVDHEGVATYRRGIHAAGPRDAVMYMTDPEMHYVDTPAGVAILELD